MASPLRFKASSSLRTALNSQRLPAINVSGSATSSNMSYASLTPSSTRFPTMMVYDGPSGSKPRTQPLSSSWDTTSSVHSIAPAILIDGRSKFMDSSSTSMPPPQTSRPTSQAATGKS